jgi:hypothetical protein
MVLRVNHGIRVTDSKRHRFVTRFSSKPSSGAAFGGLSTTERSIRVLATDAGMAPGLLRRDMAAEEDAILDHRGDCGSWRSDRPSSQSSDRIGYADVVLSFIQMP